jgi:hypothetical protein
MDKRYAVIGPDNKAINFILWDGVTQFDCGKGNSLVLIEGVERYGFGWVWDGSKFIDPNPPEGVTP